MRQVFENRMVAHIWAQQTQESGRSHNGQFYFEGKTIYSYGRHFPIATFIDADKVLYCSDSYSVTTSNHQSMVRQALSGSVQVITCPDNKVMDYHERLSPSHDDGQRKGAQLLIEGVYKESVQPLIKSAAKRKKASLVDDDLRQASNMIYNCSMLLEHYGLDLSKELSTLWDQIRNDAGALMDAKKAEIEQENAQRRKREAERKEREREDLEKAISAFRAGVHYNHSIIRQVDVMLRINGENVETSHGASFPIEDAKRAFKAVRMVKERAASWDSLDREPIRLGHFKIDRIDLHGDVKAGCHFVKWDEIERAARELNIYP